MFVSPLALDRLDADRFVQIKTDTTLLGLGIVMDRAERKIRKCLY